MHTCTHAHMHTCTQAHKHTSTQAHMHTCTHACMHACTHAHKKVSNNLSNEITKMTYHIFILEKLTILTKFIGTYN